MRTVIDSHCHLEQKDYEKDRYEIIEKCRKELRAVITSCAHPKGFKSTMEMVSRYGGFVFATFGVHPGYVREINDKGKAAFHELIRANKQNMVGIGEVGLDYDWVKEPEFQLKQRLWFIEFIELSKELDLPIIVHSRGASDDAVDILEQNNARRVLMHMFGAGHLLKRVIDNGWFISLNTMVITSKRYRKIARDAPLDKLLTETDSPWLGLNNKRNDPTSVRLVIEKIAEVKKIRAEDVDRTSTENAINFFKLNI